MREITPETLLQDFDLPTEPMGHEMAATLTDPEPNQYNLVVTNRSEKTGQHDERLYTEEGLPLFGAYADGFIGSPIPKRLQLGMSPYTRTDSASRQNADGIPTRNLNTGAEVHLKENFNILPALIKGVVAIHREAQPATEARDLTAMETRSALQSMMSLWSFERYRIENKPGRFFGKTPKPADDLALLHRTISGMFMSLSRLYISEKYHERGKVTTKKESRDFSVDNWLALNEKYDQMATTDTDGSKVVCPAPTAMIKGVMNMVVTEPEDMQQDTDALLDRLALDDPQRLIDFGRAYGQLDALRSKRIMQENTLLTEVFGSTSIRASQLDAKRERARRLFAEIDTEAERALEQAKLALGRT